MGYVSFPQVDHVEIKPYEDVQGCFEVAIYWNGVDRPNTGSTVVRGMPLANRFKKAILDGAAIKDVEIRVDVAGQTYVGFRSLVSAKYANADLRRLGY
jgi:hypothetical protein